MSNTIKLAFSTCKNFVNDTCGPCLGNTIEWVARFIGTALILGLIFSPTITAIAVADHYYCWYNDNTESEKCSWEMAVIAVSCIPGQLLIVFSPCIVIHIKEKCAQARAKALEAEAPPRLETVVVQPVQQ